jgi:hypothetical protein
MADIEKNIVIKATAETKQAEQDVNSLKGATAELEKTADKATGGIISSLKKLAKNPYMAAIGAIAGVITGIVATISDIIKKNDTLATSMGKLKDVATIPLKLISRLLEPIANGLGFIADKITTLAGRFSSLGNDLNTITDLTETLEDAQNQYNLAASATAITLNNLKAIYDDSTRPIEERIAALKEAKDAELALAEMQNNINRMELERAVLQAKNDKSWKAHQKAAFDLIKYDPTKTVEENIQNFEWQMGKLGDLDQELKDKIYTSFTNYVTSQNAISRINAEFVRKESSLTKQTINQNNRTAEKGVEDISKINERANELERERLEEYYDMHQDTYTALRLLAVDYNSEVAKLNKELDDAQKALAKATTTEQREAYNRLITEIQNKINALSISYFKNVKQLSQNAISVDDAFVDNYVENTNELKQQALERRDFFEADLQQQIDNAVEEEKERERQEEERERQIQLSKEYAIDTLNSFGNIAGSIAQMYEQEFQRIVAGKDTLTAEEKERAINALERQKSATIAQLAMQQAASIGNAILAATAASALNPIAAPFIYASTVATIMGGLLSSFMQAKQTMSDIDAQIAEVKAYSTGGYIEGAGTSTSDSIPARLSNGEAVINARSTSMYYDLLSKINQAGGGVAFPDAKNTPILRFASGGVANSTATIVEAVKTAVKDIQPVVSVKEITRVQNKLKAKEI